MDHDCIFSGQFQQITFKYDHMQKIYNEATKIFKDKVQSYIDRGNLPEFIGLNSDFDRLTAELKQISDLKDLSEKTIFIDYEAGIKIAGTKRFTGFSKENIEAFYRLKLRSIESRLRHEVP